MTDQLASALLSTGTTESVKMKLIFTEAASMSIEDFETVVKRLRMDCRFHRLVATLVNVSRAPELAVDELFSKNAFSPMAVAGFDWLYTTEGKGFITEGFIANTLPLVSSSCQKRILHRVSKWVTNTELGDRLWNIVRSRSEEFSGILLGACSNELIVGVCADKGVCLPNLSQLFQIVRKRFYSGCDLIKELYALKVIQETRFRFEAIHRLFEYILKQNIEKGVELLSQCNFKFSFGGRKLTRALIKLVLRNDSKKEYMLGILDYLNRQSLARYATLELYTECFLRKCPDQRFAGDISQWLRPLKYDSKLRMVEAWHERIHGKSLWMSASEVLIETLYLLDDRTLKHVVETKLNLIRQKGIVRSLRSLDEGLLFWQSMLPDNDESFQIQMTRLKCEGNLSSRKQIYDCILHSAVILRHPQHLGKRLRFIVKVSRNDRNVHEMILQRIEKILTDEKGTFDIDEEIWSGIKEIIDLQILHACGPRGISHDILFLVLENVRDDQKSLLLAVMDQIHKILQIYKYRFVSLHNLSEKKKLFFFRESLSRLENLASLFDAGISSPSHNELRNFYELLAKNRHCSKNVIQRYPNTIKALKYMVGPEGNENISLNRLREIYRLIKPFLAPDEEINPELKERLVEEQASLRKQEILKSFRKSKDVTSELRAFYQNQDRWFYRLVARSLIHVHPDVFSEWVEMLHADIAEGLGQRSIQHSLDILTMVSEASCFKAEVEKIYPSDAKFDLEQRSAEDILKRKRMALLQSFNLFADSAVACELVVNFMKGDYLRHSLRAFSSQTSRLTFRNLSSLLRDRVLNRKSAIGARKAFIRAFFNHSPMLAEEDLAELAAQIFIKEEVDVVKGLTLRKICKNIKQSREKSFVPLKLGLDSIEIRDLFSLNVLFEEMSVFEYFPSHIEYAFEKLIWFVDNGPCGELSEVIYRIGENIDAVSLQFAVTIFDRIKTQDWGSSSEKASFAEKFFIHFIPSHLHVLKNELKIFEAMENRVDYNNSVILTDRIVDSLLTLRSPHASEVFDTLTKTFEKNAEDNLWQLFALALASRILVTFANGTSEENLLMSKVTESTRIALNVTAFYLEECGTELLVTFSDYVKKFLQRVFPLLGYPHWHEAVIDAYHVNLPPLETLILIELFWAASGARIGNKNLVKKCNELLGRLTNHGTKAVRLSARQYLREGRSFSRLSLPIFC